LLHWRRRADLARKRAYDPLRMSAIAPSDPAAARSRILAAIFLAALAAGSLDLIYAFTMSWLLGGRSPVWVLQSIASGLLGMRSFAGGIPAAALGAVAHYFILAIAAALFLATSRRFAFVRSRCVISGLLFGLGIFVVMNFVVLPWSAYPLELAYPMPAVARGLTVHMVLGLTIALILRRA
jgi:hypothetical protein